MKSQSFFSILLILLFLPLHACAPAKIQPENMRLIPLQEASLEMVFEENVGLEVMPEDAKELRDCYRGGVQQKAKAEKLFQEKAHQEAMKRYQASNDFFSHAFTAYRRRFR